MKGNITKILCKIVASPTPEMVAELRDTNRLPWGGLGWNQGFSPRPPFHFMRAERASRLRKGELDLLRCCAVKKKWAAGKVEHPLKIPPCHISMPCLTVVNLEDAYYNPEAGWVVFFCFFFSFFFWQRWDETIWRLPFSLLRLSVISLHCNKGRVKDISRKGKDRREREEERKTERDSFILVSKQTNTTGILKRRYFNNRTGIIRTWLNVSCFIPRDAETEELKLSFLPHVWQQRGRNVI